jgi:hypothetical protein
MALHYFPLSTNLMTSYFSVKSNVLRDSGAKTATTSASAKTEPSAPSKTDPALARKDGPASFAVKEPVQIVFTALGARRFARVNPPQPNCKQLVPNRLET